MAERLKGDLDMVSWVVGAKFCLRKDFCYFLLPGDLETQPVSQSSPVNSVYMWVYLGAGRT